MNENIPISEPFVLSDAPSVRASEEKDIKEMLSENNRLLKKIKRRLKKIGQRLDPLETNVTPQAEVNAAHKSLGKKESRTKEEKSFLQKLGDAVVKAVPVLLNTMAAAIFNAFLQGKGVVRKPRKLFA